MGGSPLVSPLTENFSARAERSPVTSLTAASRQRRRSVHAAPLGWTHGCASGAGSIAASNSTP